MITLLSDGPDRSWAAPWIEVAAFDNFNNHLKMVKVA